MHVLLNSIIKYGTKVGNFYLWHADSELYICLFSPECLILFACIHLFRAAIVLSFGVKSYCHTGSRITMLH